MDLGMQEIGMVVVEKVRVRQERETGKHTALLSVEAKASVTNEGVIGFSGKYCWAEIDEGLWSSPAIFGDTSIVSKKVDKKSDYVEQYLKFTISLLHIVTPARLLKLQGKRCMLTVYPDDPKQLQLIEQEGQVKKEKAEKEQTKEEKASAKNNKRQLTREEESTMTEKKG